MPGFVTTIRRAGDYQQVQKYSVMGAVSQRSSTGERYSREGEHNLDLALSTEAKCRRQ